MPAPHVAAGDPGVLGRGSDAQVGQLHRAAVAEQDVGRLHVAMNHAVLVRVIEGARHTTDDLRAPTRAQRAKIKLPTQGRPLDVLHDDQDALVVGHGVEHPERLGWLSEAPSLASRAKRRAASSGLSVCRRFLPPAGRAARRPRGRRRPLPRPSRRVHPVSACEKGAAVPTAIHSVYRKRGEPKRSVEQRQPRAWPARPVVGKGTRAARPVRLKRFPNALAAGDDTGIASGRPTVAIGTIGTPSS